MKNLLTLPRVLLFVSYLVVTTLSVLFDKAYLEIVLPITLLVLIINYVHENRNINLFFIITIVSLMVSDYMIYTGMIANFKIVCIATSIYLITSCLALKDYFNQIKLHWSKLISLPLLISFALVIFLIISISDLVLYLLPGSIPYIIMAVGPLLVYIAISYYIYVSDVYSSGIKLLFSACLCILVIALCPINELFYPSPVFTVFVTSGHIGGIYIFMQFLTETEPISTPVPEIPKYI